MLLAPLLLALSLASDPQSVVRQFVAAEAAGNHAAASSLWTAPDRAFTRREIRRMETRCARLVDVAATVTSRSETEAVVETRETIAVTGSLAGAVERAETSHSRFTLARTADGWRIARRESLEAQLPQLETERFVEHAAGEVKRLVNARQLPAAEALARTADDVAARLGDPRSISEATSARSLVARFRDDADIALAVELCERAVAFAERSGDADTLARALLRLGRAKEERDGRIDPAPLERVLAIAGRLEDPSSAAHAATHLARYLEGQWRRREAFRYAELASRYAEASDDIAAKITTAQMLGAAFLWYGDPSLARRHFQRAYELALVGGYTEIAASMLPSIASTQELNEEAPRTIEEGLQRFTPSEGVHLLRHRISMHIRAKRFDDAERDLQVVAERERRSAASARDYASVLATIRLGQQRYDEAATLIAEARRLNTFNQDESKPIEARILRCLGREREAIDLLEQVMHRHNGTSISDPRALPFSDWLGLDPQLLMELHIEQGNIGRALEVAEHAKARLLTLTLERGGVQTVLGGADRRREQELEARIRELNRALVAGTDSPQQAEALASSLAAARADLLEFRQRALATEAAPRDTADCACSWDHMLPPSLDRVTILSYAHTEENLAVFLIGPKQNGRRAIEARILPFAARELEQKVERYLSFLEQRNLRADALGEELYAALVAPFEDAVGRADMLCIIPHRTLWRVPFHALGRDGARLIDRAPLFYAPSLVVLADAESRRHLAPSRPRSLLAFANPSIGAETAALYRAFDSQAPLGAIPETEWEVRTIAQFYEKDRSRVYVGAEAGEGILKREAAHYDVLHIATHGLVQENAPMFSSLVLSSESDAEDGVLEAREIVGLDLDTDTVVLSACDTGKPGIVGSRDPVVGLSWAFLAAGCRTTVVSQWKAQSAATATLMVEFHRQLARGASRADALRAAQTALRRDPRYRHPFYWAPFIVVGAP